MERRERIHLLYTARETPRYPGIPAGQSTLPSPICMPEAPRQPNVNALDFISSPTLSTISSLSSGSRASDSSLISAASSASSLSNTLPWQAGLPNLNQQLNMTLPNYGYELPCEFDFAGCHIRFHPDHFEHWISHSLSHFLGRSPPPSAICVFCDESAGCFTSSGDHLSNWRNRMIHIGGHYQNFESEANRRPDHRLLEYMRSNSLLTDADFKASTRYSERPSVDGLVGRDYKTGEMLKREEKASKVFHDEHNERRELRHNGKGKRSHHRSSRPHRSVLIERYD